MGQYLAGTHTPCLVWAAVAEGTPETSGSHTPRPGVELFLCFTLLFAQTMSRLSANTTLRTSQTLAKYGPRQTLRPAAAPPPGEHLLYIG